MIHLEAMLKCIFFVLYDRFGFNSPIFRAAQTAEPP